jgi:hypothetical protein
VSVQNLAQGFQSYRDWATDPIPRIGFGMDWFDRPTGGGLARSEIAMFMAFSSVGKTTFALNVVRNNPHIPVLFISLEMNWRMVAARLAAMELPSTTQNLEARLRAGDMIPELLNVENKYRAFVCDDTPRLTLKQASESFEAASKMIGTPPRLVLWDYMGLIGGGGMMNKSEQISKVAEGLRDWNRQHDCASVVLHQITKAEGGHEPLDLGSGKYGGYEPMDYVCGAYAPRLNKELTESEFNRVREEIWFQLLKSRSGGADPIGKKYRLDPSTLRISKWDSPVLYPESYRQVQAPIFSTPQNYEDDD